MKGKANKNACVIGWPISHSRSPLIHTYWLKKYGISGSYEKVAVAPEELPRFLERIREGEFVGCNVTIPHKEAVFDLVETDDPATAMLKAVNTIYTDDGVLVGSNTDGQGFFDHLLAEYPGWPVADCTIAVYGAGGAARAIIAEALARGARSVLLTNRTISRAQAIAEDFCQGIDVCDIERFSSRISETDLLVNTTALGMQGQPALTLPLNLLKPSAIVADIVYVPLQTALLRNARDGGLRTLDGLGMLLHQAVPGFDRWFGCRPEVTQELRRIVAADICAASP